MKVEFFNSFFWGLERVLYLVEGLMRFVVMGFYLNIYFIIGKFFKNVNNYVLV